MVSAATELRQKAASGDAGQAWPDLLSLQKVRNPVFWENSSCF